MEYLIRDEYLLNQVNNLLLIKPEKEETIERQENSCDDLIKEDTIDRGEESEDDCIIEDTIDRGEENGDDCIIEDTIEREGEIGFKEKNDKVSFEKVVFC